MHLVVGRPPRPGSPSEVGGKVEGFEGVNRRLDPCLRWICQTVAPGNAVLV